MAQRIKTDKKILDDLLSRLEETGVEDALLDGRFKVLNKIVFLSANEYRGCFSTKKTLADSMRMGKQSLLNRLGYLLDNGLVQATTGEHPWTGKECTFYVVDFSACSQFAIQHHAQEGEKRELRADKAREGRRTARERQREELKAELLAELKAEADAWRAEAERQRERAEAERAEAERAKEQREREELFRDVFAREAVDMKQERDRLRAGVKGAVITDHKRALLKWAYNQTVPEHKRANGNFDPDPLIRKYGSFGMALEYLLDDGPGGPINVN